MRSCCTVHCDTICQIPISIKKTSERSTQLRHRALNLDVQSERRPSCVHFFLRVLLCGVGASRQAVFRLRQIRQIQGEANVCTWP